MKVHEMTIEEVADVLAAITWDKDGKPNYRLCAALASRMDPEKGQELYRFTIALTRLLGRT